MGDSLSMTGCRTHCEELKELSSRVDQASTTKASITLEKVQSFRSIQTLYYKCKVQKKEPVLKV